MIRDAEGAVIHAGAGGISCAMNAFHAEVLACQADLKAAIEKSGVLNLNDNCCSCYDVTDMPTVKLTINEGPKRKTIEHYGGCRSAPRELGQLETEIDELSGAVRWIGTNEERRNHKWKR